MHKELFEYLLDKLRDPKLWVFEDSYTIRTKSKQGGISIWIDDINSVFFWYGTSKQRVKLTVVQTIKLIWPTLRVQLWLKFNPDRSKQEEIVNYLRSNK